MVNYITEFSPNPIVVLDSNLVVTALNTKARELTNQKSNTIIGSRFFNVFKVDQELGKKLSLIFDDLIPSVAGSLNTIKRCYFNNSIFDLSIIKIDNTRITVYFYSINELMLVLKENRLLNSRLTAITQDYERLQRFKSEGFVATRKKLIAYLFASIFLFTTLAVTLDVKYPEDQKSASLYQIVYSLLGSFSTVIVFFFAQDEGK